MRIFLPNVARPTLKPTCRGHFESLSSIQRGVCFGGAVFARRSVLRMTQASINAMPWKVLNKNGLFPTVCYRRFSRGTVLRVAGSCFLASYRRRIHWNVLLVLHLAWITCRPRYRHPRCRTCHSRAYIFSACLSRTLPSLLVGLFFSFSLVTGNFGIPLTTNWTVQKQAVDRLLRSTTVWCI